MTGLTKRCSLVFLAVLLSLCALWGRAASADDSYYYAGGKRHSLPASTNWLAVQMETDGQAAAVSAAVKARGALDASRAVRKLGRFNLVVIPIQNTNSAAARNTVRSSTGNAAGVKRVLRAFGNGQNPIIETDELVVQFKPGTSKKEAAALLAEHGAALVEQLGPYAPNGYRARVVNPNLTAAGVANALYESGATLFSHPNFIWPKQKRFLPNDPLFPQQWYLRNTTRGNIGQDISIEKAWDISRGSASVKIAILDDGVDLTHEDLAANMLPGYDFVGEDTGDTSTDDDPRPGPGDGHGTVVAGLAAAAGNNGKGVSGVAPLCKIIPVRMLGVYTTLQDEADAFRFAADRGADVISNSWGPDDNLGIEQPLPDVTKAGIDYAATSGRGGKGCVIFFAAGNGGESADLDGYASYSKVISVGASYVDGEHAAYSDYGASVDLNAPGGNGDMVVADNTDVPGNPGLSGDATGSYKSWFSGTSAAAPLAAGVAALMLSVDPSLTNVQVQKVLQDTADKNGPASSYDSKGHSDEFGYGRVNALRALQAVGYTVSGRVTTSGGAGVAGVTITATSGASKVTDGNGNYTLTAGVGSTTLTPSRNNTVFTPESKALNLTANATGVNFTAVNYGITLVAPANGSTIGSNVGFIGRTNPDDATKMDFEYRAAPFTQAATPNLAIPDASANNATPGTATSELAVTRPGVVQALSATVNVTHPFVTDLRITLIAPGGQQYVLHDQTFNGNGESADLKQTYTDIPLGATPASINGTWRLKVEDRDYDGPPGSNPPKTTLNSWSISVDPKWAVAASDTNGATAGDWTASWNASSLPAGPYEMRARGFVGSQTIVSAVSTVTRAAGYQISGRVTFNGAGVAGISVTRSASATPVVTDANGDYAFSGLANGTYTITPAPGGGITSFEPPSSTVTVTNTDVVNANFAGIKNFKISGRITASGVGVPDIAVQRTGSSEPATTDANGNYSFTALLPGTYTITPVASGPYSAFDPASKVVTLTTSDAGNVNFTTVAVLKISGRITTKDVGIANIVVNRSGTTSFARTDANGYYEFTGLKPGAYTITPKPVGSFQTFSPTARNVTLRNTDVTNADFSATPNLKISGRVLLGGKVFPGIQISRTGSDSRAKTDAQGHYVFPSLTPGTYTITPLPIGGFTSYLPASQEITLGTSDAVDVNFNAPPTLTISGRVTTNGVGIPNVSMTRTGSPGFVKTDADGYYTFSALAPGQYTITPRPLGNFKTFSASKTVTLDLANVAKVDFTTAAVLSIRGRVTSGGVGIPDVTVNRSGTTGFVKTDAAGDYVFANLPPGKYTVTPKVMGVFTTYKPGSADITLTSVDENNVNFVAPTILKISGRITSGGVGVGNVSVTRSGSPGFVKTDANGNYTFPSLPPGTYVITPRPLGEFTTYAPTPKSVTIGLSDATGVNFTTPSVLKISGRIVANGVGVENVTVKRSGSDGFVKTDATGAYSFTGLPPGTYVITPRPLGAFTTYSPASKEVTVVSASAEGVSFTAVQGSAPVTRASSGQLSTAKATSDGMIKLIFTRALAVSAANPDLYEVEAGIESAGVKGNTLTLTVPEGSWRKGDRVTVRWHGVKDWQGAAIADGAATTTVQ